MPSSLEQQNDQKQQQVVTSSQPKLIEMKTIKTNVKQDENDDFNEIFGAKTISDSMAENMNGGGDGCRSCIEALFCCNLAVSLFNNICYCFKNNCDCCN
jgi:thiazole synthase ThiGH ThiG subunit